ncbi:MAG TPA: serine hydrolase [Aggregatilinea sp.]|uniref:serine hydrolase domain-containing protein n=1 Tax=Aggregatilinea sp. TaxID=2806333 RepID=UPI002CEEF40B|nr:serine hydrolase [Aggregatilinea sp.]HML22654.1 serine hydrolase [Aggregatilinea sp.]
MTGEAAQSLAATRDYWPTRGWREADPAARGMDVDKLAEADRVLAADYPNIESLLVVRSGDIVYARYNDGTGPDKPHNLKSATKSVLSSLVGIALNTGDLNSLDDPLSDFLPEMLPASADRRKRAITVRDLLRMRSGIEWNEWGGCTVEMTSRPNWLRFVLDQPLAHDPGEIHAYSTGDTQLLSAVLQRATGMTALDFADLFLFKPLGITQRTWTSDPQGYTIGGTELALSPRDLAKFAYLYLNGGRWENRQVIPAAWVAESTQQHSLVVPPDNSDRPPIGYGYLWWIREQAGHPSFMAVGFAGQFAYVIPDLDLIVVMNGRLRRVPAMFADNRMIREFNVVADYIVPAVTDGA